MGQALILAGPGPSYQIDPDADWFVLAGDDAALPAIETILDALPAEARVRVVLEVADEHEERPLATAAQFDITWLHRGAHAAHVDTAVEDAIRTMQLPTSHRK